MNIASIRDGLKTRLATVSGLRAFDTIPMEFVPPAAVVVPDDPFIDYHEAFKGGLCLVRFRVTLLASRASERTGQDKLDSLLSAGTGQSSSILDAVDGDRTLGGTVSDCVVDEAVDYGTTDVAGNSYWKADLRLRILVGRT